MPMVTGLYVETQQVVSGFIYELHIAEDQDGQGITRLEIGPYYFPGVPPQIKYPEALTNEMIPPGWQPIRWYTDDAGASWLRYDGGRINPGDGDQIFQFVSNFPPSSTEAFLYVFHGKNPSAQKYGITAPDYSQSPPEINPRHDCVGRGKTFAVAPGCLPPVSLAICSVIVLILRHILS